MQEHSFKALRVRQVVSLISFGMKGAYNGVYKDQLLQRLTMRGFDSVGADLFEDEGASEMGIKSGGSSGKPLLFDTNFEIEKGVLDTE
jgi:hypothetical protein